MNQSRGGLREKSLVATAALGVVMLGPGVGLLRPAPAMAQDTSAGFAADRFEPATAGSDWFSLESLDFRGHLRPAGSLTLDFGHRPLIVQDENGNEVNVLLKDQLVLHVGAALNLFQRLRVGLSLPVSLYQAGEGDSLDGGTVTVPSPAGAALGDLRLTADVRLLGEYGGPVSLAIGTQAFFPTGKRDHFTSDGQVRVAPRALLAGQVSMFEYAVRAGFQYRKGIAQDVFHGAGTGSEVFVGAAAGIRATPALLIGPEFYGSTVVTNSNAFHARTTPLEVLIGGHYTVADDWRLGLGVAPGLTTGLGEPAVRVVAQVQYFPAVAPPDRDGDGVLDREDACPDVPGIRTGDPHTNGCPPPSDRDKDGIVDAEDACPDVPGVKTNDPKTNGCPPAPPPDRDKDGIIDAEDACPDVPGVKTDDPKTNGCPADRDKDGIPDSEDACPDVPGTKTDNPKTNGCADKDGDGIFDPEDACPFQAGPRDPDPTKNGCPLARVEKGQIRITQQVKFKLNSSVILRESDYILDAVKKIIDEHPEIKKVRVEGHTDDQGTAGYNMRLSKARARSVVKWLVSHGVNKKMLTAEGFGRERPLDPAKTEEARAMNRRVELHITDPATMDAAPAAP
jgi:outer membrane protein OmpA-like peptidoglycan-associated protein